jgi:hypothetical protein
MNLALRNGYLSEFEKLASSDCSPVACKSVPYEDEWLARFAGSPFYDAAEQSNVERAQESVEDAQQDILRQRKSIADSIRRLKRTQLEASLAKWKLEQDRSKGGKTKKASALRLVPLARRLN